MKYLFFTILYILCVVSIPLYASNVEISSKDIDFISKGLLDGWIL